MTRRQNKMIKTSPAGFALVATLSLMTLIILLCVAMLSAASSARRASSISGPQERARANARMALMLAVGELQKSMGPDMRVSATSSILDTDENTERIDGVAQAHWLGVYDSWGDWLNNSYTPPGKSSLLISDTYTKGRDRMFRRWLVSLPGGMEYSFNSPLNPIAGDEENWVTLVGSGTLGKSTESGAPDHTKAYLTDAGKMTGSRGGLVPKTKKPK